MPTTFTWPIVGTTVYRFSPARTRSYVATLGSYGSENGQFWEPTDVAVDTLGNLYVADFVNTRVQQFDKNRTYLRTYGVARVPYLTDDYHYNNPIGVAAAADGSLYIVEDNGHRLVKLNAAGQPLWTVGVPGLKGDWDSGNDKLNNPADVALDAAGRVYVADQWHGRIQIFNPDGSYYATLDNGGTAENQVGCPTGVTLAPNGYLYVTDPCSQRVQIFDRNLLYLATHGHARRGRLRQRPLQPARGCGGRQPWRDLRFRSEQPPGAGIQREPSVCPHYR